MSRKQLPLLSLIVLAAGVVMAFLHAATTLAFVDFMAGEHVAILNGTSTDPWRFRVLTPLAIDLFMGSRTPAAVHTAYAFAHMLLLPVTLLLLFNWAKQLHPPLVALIGVLVTAVYFPLVFMNDYTLGLWSVVELALFSAAMLTINRPSIFLGLVIIATLNRETAVFLPIAWAAWHWKNLRRSTWAIVHFAAWAVVYGGVRFLIGPGAPFIPLADAFARNTGTNFAKVIVAWAMLIPFGMLVVIGFRSASNRARRLVWVAAAYMPLFLIFGLWHEVRLLLTIIPFVLPAALYAVQSFNLSDQAVAP